MPLSLRLSPPAAPAVCRVVAMLALAAGLGAWGAVLLAPKPPALPAAVSAPPPRAADNMPVALWFGRDEVLRTQISVLGVIAAGADGAAVFS
ncbi:MAG: general secretion pathway protein GspC, partial [Achromobacter sp.]|nr:general secretion pathway protein GspC [Achromobacter sp.]